MKEKKQISVLLADDSFFSRKLLREILSDDEQITIVGEAKDGSGAIGEAVIHTPDVILLDYNMPDINGAEIAEQILNHDERYKPAIIMFSAYTHDDAEETLECLRAGAVDFIPKPQSSDALIMDKLAGEIIAKVKGAAGAKVTKRPELKPVEISANFDLPEVLATKVVVIGASTGGPPIVEDILSALPEDLTASVIIVQHMTSEYFTGTFAKRMNGSSKINVKHAASGDLLSVGRVLVAPGRKNLDLVETREGERGRKVLVRLLDVDEWCGETPSIDLAMTAAAHLYGDQCIGVILSGMGEDGRVGMEAIKAVSGHTIAQDPDTAVVASMPNAVIDADLVDDILKPEDIAKKIIKLCS